MLMERNNYAKKEDSKRRWGERVKETKAGSTESVKKKNKGACSTEGVVNGIYIYIHSPSPSNFLLNSSSICTHHAQRFRMLPGLSWKLFCLFNGHRLPSLFFFSAFTRNSQKKANPYLPSAVIFSAKHQTSWKNTHLLVEDATY